MLFENTQSIAYVAELLPNNSDLFKAKLCKPFLIEPNVKYDIQFEIERGYKRAMLMQTVSVNNIEFRFYPAEGETDASTAVILSLYFTIFSKWTNGPMNVFFRSRQSATTTEHKLEQFENYILKFLDILNFITSLMI